MQQRRASVMIAVAAASLACLGLLLFGGSPLPAAAGTVEQVGATPMAAQGTVTTGPLGVRAEPALTSRVIGTLPAGSQVNVLDQQGSSRRPARPRIRKRPRCLAARTTAR